MDPEHARRLERMYDSAPINAFLSPHLTVEEGRAEVTARIRPDFHHAAGFAHGAILFKLLDDAAFFAANSLETEHFVVTVGFNLHFLRPVADGDVRAVGRVVNASKRLVVADAVVTDADGRELARGSGTFMPSRVPLGPEIGYE